MRINQVNVNVYQAKNLSPRKSNHSNVEFQGRHDCAKIFGSVAAGLGTLGALGGIAIMTGGISLIPTAIYGALCGGIGAVGGHIIDKAQPDYNKKK
jgi:hypothetical protein